MTLTSSSEQKISQMQMLEQSIQNYGMQKQQLQTKTLEIDSALEELEDVSDAYKIIGNIMVKTDSETLKSSLIDDKEKNQIRINAIEKQENQMQEKAKTLQQEIMDELQESKNDK